MLWNCSTPVITGRREDRLLVMNEWLVLRTRPSSEKIAAEALKINGYSVYSPRIDAIPPPFGHRERPLFPGYLFVRNEVVGLPALDKIAGTFGWVNFEGVIASVSEEVISEVRRRVDSINKRGGDWNSYTDGQDVLVKSGVIDNLAIIVGEAKLPQSRVKVLLNFAGRLVPAVVPWVNVRPVGENVAVRPARRTRGRGRWIRGFGTHIAT